MEQRSIRLVAMFAVVLLPPAALYLASGISDGFLEADDFSWLTTARDQAWGYIFSFGGYDHFYRPVIRAWFFGAVRVCHDSSGCYHSLNLLVHLINVLLFTALSLVVTRDRLFSAIAALTFAVSPGYVEAVAWVSAITELLSTLFLLTAALLVFRGTDRKSSAAWYLAALAALLAVFAHEASAVLFGLIPLLMWTSGRVDQIRPRRVWPFIVVGGVALLAIIVANQRNPIFTEAQYTVGAHMIRQALDYGVSMYVGPHRWTGRVFVALAAVTIVVCGPRLSRAGVIWILIAMLPYLGFTTGNASRYLYLPTMGFGWIAAALLLALHRRISAFTSYRLSTAVVSLITVAALGRFCVFTSRSIATHDESSAAYRHYAQSVIDRGLYKNGALELVVPAPSSRVVDRDSIPPMLRWVLKQRELTVIVEDTAEIESH